MIRLNWTLQAVEDLESIAEFIARDSVKYSKLQILRIREKAQSLKLNATIGRIVPEMDQKDIRELILGNYRIIYKTVDSTRVDILTIQHSARLLIDDL